MINLVERFKIKSEEENRYTSTGIKFWRHPIAMKAYRAGEPNSIISTHVSPEGHCNLKCPYCSVSKRKINNRIELDAIKKYIQTLQKFGLKAVILTGGGEPTLYPQFNELVSWIVSQDLSIALITNGTNIDRVDPNLWKHFSWVRVSLNFFDGYQDRIKFPKIEGILGASMVYIGQSIDEMRALSRFVPPDVKYIRILPNCLHEQETLIREHEKIAGVLEQVGDSRFFQQFKIHRTPKPHICHQAYFRPYLSEVNGGTVFPCDSLVLNDAKAHFSETYSICSINNVEDFLRRKINMKFDPTIDCSGCVFADNVDMLGDWLTLGKNRFDEFSEALTHEEFV